MEKISHIGSLWTMTDFKLKDGSQIRLKVGLRSSCTVANTHTFYTVHVYIKGYKCRNWVYEFESDNCVDKRILEKVTEQQLYDAYYNHWQKLNPVRIFSKSQCNSELRDFSVIESKQDKHFAY